MFNWAKQQLAHVAGTQEPIYGPDAIQPVSKQAEATPYTELAKEDLKWITPDSSCVETQTFYIHSDAGPFAFVQIIHSNVAISTTVQFNTQVYYLDGGKTSPLWLSDPLDNVKIDKDRYNLSADGCSTTLSPDGNTYTIKSTRNKSGVVNITFTKSAPGFVVGKDGTTLYGTDHAKPWGSMYHSFWPRCKVEGSVITPSGELNLTGTGMFIHALQGMKPHHCAARWNFVNFHSPRFTAVMMEFTTPPSYASTVVNVGGIVDSSDILVAGTTNTATHTTIKGDPEVNWPEPSAARYVWKGRTKDGKEVEGEIEGELGTRLDRVDVMGELPGFIKSLASTASGTRPYIYQYAPKMKLKVKTGDEVVEEEGLAFIEATFIS